MAKSRAQRRSKLQERRIAEDIGGRVVSGSGSSWRAKSDVRKMGQLRVEAKYTERGHYDLKLADWKKIRREAITNGLETPVMQIEFVNQAGGLKLAVMDFGLFHHWYSFSQGAAMQLQECWIAAKQYRLDLGGVSAVFDAAAHNKNSGVLKLVFEEDDGTKHYLAVIQWHLFTTINEEYDHG